MGKDNQTKKILRYLEEEGSITALDALREFGCMRLGARIWDLKNKEGFIIRTETERTENRYGEPVHYARYYLEGRA